MAGQASTSATRSLNIAAIGFVVWALGYIAVASPINTAAWEWLLCIIGPLLIVVAVLSNGAALRARIGATAIGLLVISLILAALEFAPLAFSLGAGSKSWAAVPYELWGTAWIVGGFGVVATIVHLQRRGSAGSIPFAALSVLSSGMIVYGLGFDELGTERLSHLYGAEAFGGAVLIALALIAMRRQLTSIMGAGAAGIVIVVVAAWALKDVFRVFGDLLTNSTFSKEMIFGFGAAAFVLGAIACLVAARRNSAAHH